MSIRDNVLPKLDVARTKIAQVGLRNMTVTLRRRTWSGARVGDGTPSDSDIVLVPSPRVRFLSPAGQQMTAIMQSGGSIRDRYYKIDKITPRYANTDGSVGGYTPQELRMRVGPDVEAVEPIVVLVGDDGMLRECSQLVLEDDRSFGYSMVCQEKDKPSVALVSIAVTPSPAALTMPATLQLKAIGTFEDRSSYDVTSICKWSSGTPSVATVDLLGNLTGLAAGTSSIVASLNGITAPAIVLTVS